MYLLIDKYLLSKQKINNVYGKFDNIKISLWRPMAKIWLIKVFEEICSKIQFKKPFAIFGCSFNASSPASYS